MGAPSAANAATPTQRRLGIVLLAMVGLSAVTCLPVQPPMSQQFSMLHPAGGGERESSPPQDRRFWYRYTVDTACANMIAKVHKNEGGQNGVDTVLLGNARRCSYSHDLRVRGMIQSAMRMEFQRLGRLLADIPEYHDEQRLLGGAPLGTDELGPMATIFASPTLGHFRQRWQFEAHASPGVLVGYVLVVQEGAEPLPKNYSDLQLNWGLNCVFLEANAGGAGYKAWVATPPTVAGQSYQDVCRKENGSTANLNSATPLLVKEVALPPVFTQDSIIPAARFMDDQNGLPVLGIPCLDKICLIGNAAGFTPRTGDYCGWFSAGSVTCGQGKEALIPTWYDEQQMEEKVGNKWKRTTLRAAIVPEKDLDQNALSVFTNTKILVGRMYLDADPPNPGKMWHRGLRKGENKIWLTNEIASGKKWYYQVEALGTGGGGGAGTLGPSWPVLGPHRHYDAPVPGTMRFRFTITDPGIWGPCGQYCCDSDGM